MSNRVSSPRPSRPKKDGSKKDGSKVRRTAVKRPRPSGRGASAQGRRAGSRWRLSLAGRPVPLIGVVVVLMVAGITLGWVLGAVTGRSDAPVDTAGLDRLVAENTDPAPAEKAPLAVPQLADPSSLPPVSHPYEADYGPAIVPPEPLGQGFDGGVRLSDPLATGSRQNGGTAPQAGAGAGASPSALVPGTLPSEPPSATSGKPVDGSRLPPEDRASSDTEQQAAVIQKGWRDAAVPVPVGAGQKPMVAIVIDDMGIDKGRSAKISSLPGPLTTSFLTYASDLKKQAGQARKAGHELMMHVPMQPQGKIDAGPDVLTVGMETAQIRRRMEEYLGRLDGIVGINNHMGSAFTEHAEGLRPVMEVLKEHHLFFLDSKTTGRSVGSKVALENGIPAIDRNVFLDHEETAAFVSHQLAQTEAIARKHGYAVAIGHPKDVTINGLRQWLPTLQEKGIVLVPLSTLIRLRSSEG